MIVWLRKNWKKTNCFVKSRWLNISKWMSWSKKRKKSINHFFTNTTTSAKIVKIILIKTYQFTLFDINSSKFENFEKKNKCVERMYFMNSKIDEMFYLRLLLVNRMNCTSFENLRTMFVQIENVKKNEIEIRFFNTYQNVVRAFELIDNDDEWHVAITKTIEFDTIVIFRNLIMIILLKCK